MKIGILTFWITCRENYGTALQAFALQHVLRQMGHEPFLIRYVHKNDFRTMPFIKYLWACFLTVRSYIMFWRLLATRKRERMRDFRGFWHRRLSLSDKVYHGFVALCGDCPAADVYIAGGDQLWNCFSLSREGRTWFLDFVPDDKRRISYSVSVGALRSAEKYIEFMRPLLQKFSHISVREKLGVEICQKAGYDNACQVCDPTLLMTGAEWRREFPGRTDGIGVLVYAINIQCCEDIYWNEIRKFAEDRGTGITLLPSQGAEQVFPASISRFPTVEGFMEIYRGAEYIITNSYHGMIFSIINHKPFAVVLQRGRTESTNDRCFDLLNIFGLENRLCRDGRFDAVFCNDIDWDAVDLRWAEYRRHSLDYLKNSISQ